MDPWLPLFDTAGRECHAWNHCFERGGVEATRAWVTAEEEVTAVGVAGHTVACCVAARVAMAGDDPAATCAVAGTRALDFGHQEASRLVP
jgi:hypothetical protein